MQPKHFSLPQRINAFPLGLPIVKIISFLMLSLKKKIKVFSKSCSSVVSSSGLAQGRASIGSGILSSSYSSNFSVSNSVFSA